MIECVFTVDYEIYGNGCGSLRELAYSPAQALLDIFRNAGARLVVFPDVAELEMIEANKTDSDLRLVRAQLAAALEAGHELGLHIHPWWYKGRYCNGMWELDHSEYNLCTLSYGRIEQIIDRSLRYLGDIVGNAGFTPRSYRAGHLLFQPARDVATILAERGIKIDSSVYKGGVWRRHNLDYRPARHNGYYWRFSDSSVLSDADGRLLELPIYTTSVPPWRMFTGKRIALKRKASSTARKVSGNRTVTAQSGRSVSTVLSRASDYMRFSYPLKLDFCSMTLSELRKTIDDVIREDRADPKSYRPIVLIGHTKDLVDCEPVEKLLDYLARKGIRTSTLEGAYRRCSLSM